MFFEKNNETYHLYIDRIFKDMDTKEQEELFTVFITSYILKATGIAVTDIELLREEFDKFFLTLNNGNTSTIYDEYSLFFRELSKFHDEYFKIDGFFHTNNIDRYSKFSKKMDWQ